MIGASVDNIRTCKCNVDCQDIVVEYKCPWKHRDQPPKEAFLTPEIGGTSILFDKEFMASLCKKVESFWYGSVFPAMVDELTNNDSAPNKTAGKRF